MKRFVLALLILVGTVQAESNPWSYPKYVSSSSGSVTSGTAINASSISATSIADSQLTSGSIPYASNGGLLLDSGAFWTPSVTTLGITGGVSATGIVSSSGGIYGPDGTDTRPGWSFGSDTDSGVVRKGNNQININVAAGPAIRIAQSTIGIMASNSVPSATFHVGTQCINGACPGSGMFAGQLSVGVGSAGGSVSVAGMALYASGTSQFSGAVSMTSNVRMSGLALSAGLDYLCISTVTSETTYNTTTCTVSDRKYKRNIADAEGLLDVALQLRPRNYDWKDGLYPGAGRQLGFVAQEVQSVIPSLVATGSNGDLSLDYAKMSVVAIGAVNEMQDEVDELRIRAGLPPHRSTFGERVRWLFTGQ